MTGSLRQYTRQHSSTATNSSSETNQSVKFRRCSSADEHNAPEIVFDDSDQKDSFLSSRQRTTTDDDSGTEEVDHPVFASLEGKKEGSDDTNGTFNVDEGFSENEPEEKSKDVNIDNDLDLAEKIPDAMKKDFCRDTMEAFHGEFARLISIPLSLSHGVRSYLFAAEELVNGYSMDLTGPSFLKLDNAKAQFKCTNAFCQHAWTSMRARIFFHVFGPDPGFVILEILGQDCQLCHTYVDAVWYIDEVCRVMKCLARFIFETYYPDMLSVVNLPMEGDLTETPSPLRHNRSQRKGNMHAPHVRESCPACRLGMCFT